MKQMFFNMIFFVCTYNLLILNHIEYYTMNISDQNYANNYMSGYGLIDPSSFLFVF